MAIKLPDPGNGIPEQKTGNDEWTNMKIVRDNFADPSHAASRLVGTSTGNLLEAGAFGLGGSLVPSETIPTKTILPTGFYYLTSADRRAGGGAFALDVSYVHNSRSAFRISNDPYTDKFYVHGSALDSESGKHAIREGKMLYHTGNTTTDSNKNIKTSSPVVRVFSDHLDKIHEANDLPIKYTRNGVGDYTIEGTTGLRENDWQIVIPEDDHRNQLIAFTIEDDMGTIHLKTYKRTFSMETFTFGPDLSSPLDIPEGRWVDLHFNDLPQEQLDEPAI